MTTPLILLAGLIVVIGGIVVLRLPAFLALVLSALLVAVLTPREQVFQALLSQTSDVVTSVSEQTVDVSASAAASVQEALVSPRLSDDGTQIVHTATGQLEDGQLKLSDASSREHVTTGDLVATVATVQQAQVQSGESALHRVTSAMGGYFARLAIIIVCASVIGRCLLDSGAAERIVRSLLQLLGQSLAPAALTAGSFMLGIPVFFDTVFYLMIPVAKTLRARTGGNYLLYVLAIVSGATMAHSLVPPTPGPLAVAEMLNVSLPQMVLGGLAVGLVAAGGGLLWSWLLNIRFQLALPDSDQECLSQNTEQSDCDLPALGWSVLPVVLPLLLIAAGPLVGLQYPFLRQLSEKNTALLLSTGVSLLLYVKAVRPSRQTMATAMQAAVSSAGSILLITCAGGAFGKILFQTNVASQLQHLPASSPVLLVSVAFLITAAIRTAQGSATVAMMTSAGILGPLVVSGSLPVSPLYLALAIGCGSKPVSWMNDSGFWIITRMSGMSETQGLKFVSTLMTIMGITGLLAVIAGVLLLPQI